MNEKDNEHKQVFDFMLQKTYNFVIGLKRYGLFTDELKDNLSRYYSEIYNLLKQTPLPREEIRQSFLTLFQKCGTHDMHDLLTILYGENYSCDFKNETGILHLLLKYFHPITFERTTSSEAENKFVYCTNIQQKKFFIKVFGMNVTLNKTLTITGYFDNVIINDFVESVLTAKRNAMAEFTPNDDVFIKSLNVKDVILLSPMAVQTAINETKTWINDAKKKNISHLMREFLSADLFGKRSMILKFATYSADNAENRHYTLFLFELLNDDASMSATLAAENMYYTRSDQMCVFESFPFWIQEMLQNVICLTKPAVSLLSIEPKVSYEQQIMFMKANDTIKEKAHAKLKELKSKSEESAFKAKQYLEGLLKIPFGSFREEAILLSVKELRKMLKTLMPTQETASMSYIDIVDCVKQFDLNISDLLNSKKANYKNIFTRLQQYDPSLFTNGYSKQEVIKFMAQPENPLVKRLTATDFKTLGKLRQLLPQVPKQISTVEECLNKAVVGHMDAKAKLTTIVGQWIHGKHNGGYCLGFEGPPGVGKTSLAKCGLSECLKDENGQNRPFHIIALGGDVNGSTLHGHHYTYLGSIWGSITQILMDSKCMNPIILLDEVDKVSKSEHGKEIIGVLTHILDSTQNDSYQDKYFNGIEIDLSKVIFILSYNDGSMIDHILLDRVERIRFKSLTNAEKLQIAKTIFIPELLGNYCLLDKIIFPDTVLQLIVDAYTHEAGCRKLRQLLNEIIGKINLSILANKQDYVFPLEMTEDLIRNTFFTHLHPARINQIHTTPKVGTINCLYANDYGQGGILLTVGKLFPSKTFLDLKLTGLLDNMMSESFQVAKTLAWSLTSEANKELFKSQHGDSGVHIHCGDGSVNKSGTSAGVAITLLLYSIFNDHPIPNDFAVTGEINLDGNVCAIGALEYKVIGGIKAGVKNFIFPQQNVKDFDLFSANVSHHKNVNYFPVHTIAEIIPIVFFKT